MPWKVKEPMDERISLITDWKSGNYSITELSVIYGVSRKAVYKWTTRYEEHGIDGLKEMSRAPLSHPNQTKAEVVEELIKEKMDHGRWGPKKLLSASAEEQAVCAMAIGVHSGEVAQEARFGKGAETSQEGATIQRAVFGM